MPRSFRPFPFRVISWVLRSRAVTTIISFRFSMPWLSVFLFTPLPVNFATRRLRTRPLNVPSYSLILLIRTTWVRVFAKLVFIVSYFMSLVILIIWVIRAESFSAHVSHFFTSFLKLRSTISPSLLLSRLTWSRSIVISSSSSSWLLFFFFLSTIHGFSSL